MSYNIKEIFRPKFFGLFRKGKYNRQTFVSDLIAGVIVGIIALPLAIAFGIASGVPPQVGLITAIVAGFLISFFGGSNFLIGGPTGAFIVIVAGIVAKFGMQGLIIASIMAGIILVAMGLLRLGGIFKFIPYPIVVGFTSGIALTIFSTQMKDFFGFGVGCTEEFVTPAGFIPEWIAYFTHLDMINWAEAASSIVCLLVIIFWGRINKKIPGSLVALILGTAVSVCLDKFAGIELATIGSKFSELANGLPMPKPVLPQVNFEMIRGLVAPAFTIAILCAIESLLAAMVADGATGKHHNADTELIGQGIANIVTPLFGGIPATGALARTMASINNGGKTPVTGLIHAVVLLLIYLFLMPYAVYIPLSALAAILVMVAYNMSEWRTFKYLLKGDKADVAVLLLTFFLTVIVDLTVAIEVGLLLAVILFVRRVMQTSTIEVLDHDSKLAGTENDEIINPEDTPFLDIPAGVDVYEINGPFFFGLASRFNEFAEKRRDAVNVRIIRMRKVPFIDSTGVNNLKNLIARNHQHGVKVILSGVNPTVQATLHRFGVDALLSDACIQPHIIPALERARQIIGGE